MLISIHDLNQKYNLKITGILHIGAHECEELTDYQKLGIKNEDIVWIEGNTQIVKKVKSEMPTVTIFNELISDKDDEEIDFIITNNGQSSSILELKEHLIEHPHVYESSREKRKTKTIDTLFKEQNLPDHLNFVNIDIQGAELKALKGMKNFLHNVHYLYLEVNTKELYSNCCFLQQIDDYLRNFGFERKDIAMTVHGWGDAFYIKNK